jgi:hypothetical protein
MESSIIVAIIGLVGAVIVALIQKSRKENKADHNVVAHLLEIVHHDVTKVEDKLDTVRVKLDNHISDHKAEKIQKIKPQLKK